MTRDVYDSDDARNVSPPPMRQRIDYAVHETLPPFIAEKSESPVGKRNPSERKRPHRRRKHPRPSIADEIILKSLAPNRPDLAYEYGQTPLQTDSPSEESLSDRDDENIRTVQHSSKLPRSGASGAAEAAQGALSILNSGPHTREHPDALLTTESSTPGPSMQDFSKDKSNATRLPSVSQIFSNPDTQSPRITPNFPDMRSGPTPGLREFSLLASCPPVIEALPVLQSPPQTTSGNSPETGQSLPSFKSSFPSEISEAPMNDRGGRNGVMTSSFSIATSQTHAGNTTTHTRRPSDQYLPTYIPPTTSYPHIPSFRSKESSDLSTVVSSNSQSFWAPSLKQESSRSRSSCEPSSQYGDSPSTSYPTPVEPGKYDGTEGSLERMNSSTPVNSVGSFKCTFDGCKAPPFQTQYLLNSHANVHSQLRPYYCPVQDCPRGEGGEGFKRKNEMIRHGLVHDSPGYVCPFCPDQRHRYPRPDNLQRHVRVHHVDKDREDPLLRKVLAQRPEGACRGRRRRA